MKLGELFFELGFKDFGKENYENFNKNLKNVSKNSKNMLIDFNNIIAKTSPMKRSIGEFVLVMRNAALSIMGVSTAMMFLEKKAGDSAIALDKFGLSSVTGLSTDQLQRYDVALKQTGGSIADLTSAISLLQSKSIDVALGRGGDLGVYAFLGLNPHDDPIKQLDTLAHRLRTMPTALGTKMARDLGLSDNLIYFLKNREQLFSIKKGTLVSESEMKRLREFSFYFTSVWEQAKRTFSKFAAAVSPVLTVLLKSFDRITYVISLNMDRMSKFFGSLRQYSHWIFLAISAVMYAISPLTFALSMIYLIIDDIATYLSGGKSIIGVLLKQPWFQGMIKSFLGMYETISSKITELKPKIAEMYQTITKKIGEWIDYLKPKFLELYKTLSEKASEWFDIMKQKFSELYKTISTELPVLKDKISSFYQIIIEKVSDWIKKLKDGFKQINNSFFDAIIRGADYLLQKLDQLRATLWKILQFFTIGGYGKYEVFFTKKIREAELGRNLTPEELKEIEQKVKRKIESNPMGSEMDTKFFDIIKKGLGFFPDLNMENAKKIEGTAKGSDMDDRIINFIKKGWNALNFRPFSSNETNKNVINKNSITIHVSGAKSPDATAEVIKNKISQAFFQFGSKEAYS